MAHRPRPIPVVRFIATWPNSTGQDGVPALLMPDVVIRLDALD